jgi:SMC interacting uncharacterized protein involved in chromosome segregation
MTENVTEETNGSRSFEERVFARFDAVDERFNRVEGRLGAVEISIGKLEARQYDTKPIWEQALAAITETNRTMREGFDLLRNEFRTEIRSEIEGLRGELRNDLAGLRTEMNAEIGGLSNEIGGLRTEMNAEIGRLSNEIGGLRAEMKLGFAGIRQEMERSLHGVERKIDVLNHNILDLQAEQRYVDSRLQEVESQTKPT